MMKSAVMTIVKPPKFSQGVLKVWKRNYLYFKKTLLITFFWIFFEPMVNLLAIGWGLGAYISNMEGASYLEFYLPGLLCSTAMMVAFFESTYASFTKLVHQRTFESILLAPIELHEVILAEILWATSKSLLSVFGILLVSVVTGLIGFLSALLAFLILIPISWFFASFGLFVTSKARNYDFFIYFISGIIVPMSLISGTYFPLHQLPNSIRYLANLLPLTHGIDVLRSVLQGHYEPLQGVQLLVIFLFSFIFMNLAMKTLLIKFEEKL